MSDEELKDCPFCGDGYAPVTKQDEGCQTCLALNRWVGSLAPITREQVNDWCRREGMAVVPIEPPNEALKILKIVRDGHLSNCQAYRDIVYVAQEDNEE